MGRVTSKKIRVYSGFKGEIMPCISVSVLPGKYRGVEGTVAEELNMGLMQIKG